MLNYLYCARFSLILPAVLLATFCAAGDASAVITHDDNVPLDVPHPDVIGQYGTNACAVAISPYQAITTVHQGGSLEVKFGGVTYYARTDDTGGFQDTADIRLFKLYVDPARTVLADLRHYVNVYTGTSEKNKEAVIGGFGMVRGAELTKQLPGQDPITYGYDWGGINSNNNPLTWGTNKIDNTKTVAGSAVIYGDFDGPGAVTSTTYEATIAEHDSGGGIFMRVDGIWTVIGLGRGVDHVDEREAWFRNDGWPDVADPDYWDAVRVGSYDDWILSYASSVNQPVLGDYNGDGYVDSFDYGVWASTFGSTTDLRADGNGDGIITQADYTIWAGRFGAGNPTAAAQLIPEPATALLLAMFAPLLMKRRRSAAS